MIINNDDSYYRQEIDHFVAWCADNYLELNVKKTIEMSVDFRKDEFVFHEILIMKK